jgi:hypothetical protein
MSLPLRIGGVMLAVMLAAALLLPTHGSLPTPHDRTVRLLRDLDLAVREYEKAYGVYPPGDGRGTRSLVHALGSGRGGCGFLDDAEVVDDDIPNPMGPGVVHYLRNPPGMSPPFEIWILDTEGRRPLLIK